MHLWNPAPVAVALRSDLLTERDKYHYILASGVLHALIGSPAVFTTHRSMDSLAFALAVLAMFVIGLRECYRQNRAGDDHAFVERYLCLTVPISVQLYAAYFVAWWISVLTTKVAQEISADAAATLIRPYFVLVSVLIVVVYFGRLRHFVRVASGVRAA